NPSWDAGGPPRVAYEISKELTRRGHDVTVYTTDGFKRRLAVPRNQPVDVDGITTYYFGNLSPALARRAIVTPYYAPTVVRSHVRDFDVVDIHEFGMLGSMVAHYARSNGLQYLLRPHGGLLFAVYA